MTSLDILIAYHESRRLGAAEEIARIEKLPEGKSSTHDEHDCWIADWEEVRKLSRDTVAYLQAFKNRGVKIEKEEP